MSNRVESFVKFLFFIGALPGVLFLEIVYFFKKDEQFQVTINIDQFKGDKNDGN